MSVLGGRVVGWFSGSLCMTTIRGGGGGGGMGEGQGFVQQRGRDVVCAWSG